MTIIEIAALENGAHNNQTICGVDPSGYPIPAGWALLPESVGAPDTLESFPFGGLVAEEIDGVMTVTSWTPGTMPEPAPVPAPPAALTDAEMAAAIQEGVDAV